MMPWLLLICGEFVVVFCSCLLSTTCYSMTPRFRRKDVIEECNRGQLQDPNDPNDYFVNRKQEQSTIISNNRELRERTKMTSES